MNRAEYVKDPDLYTDEVNKIIDTPTPKGYKIKDTHNNRVAIYNSIQGRNNNE